MPNGSTVSSPRVRRKREARREQILATAISMVAADGLAGLTIQRLAKQLDYSNGALYRYFPSKDALVVAMQRHAIEALHAEFRAARQQFDSRETVTGAAPQTRRLYMLLASADLYLGLLKTMPHHVRLISFLLGDPRRLVSDEGARKNAPALVALLGEVDRMFADAAKDDALAPGDSRDRTLILWSSLQGVTQLDKMSHFDARLFHPQRLGANLVRALLCGWGANPAHMQQAELLLESEKQDAPLSN